MRIARHVGQRQRLPRRACSELAPHQQQQHQNCCKVIPKSRPRALPSADGDWSGGEGGGGEGRWGGRGIAARGEIGVVSVISQGAMKRLIWRENWRVIQQAACSCVFGPICQTGTCAHAVSGSCKTVKHFARQHHLRPWV
jgi:hypothetical protein